MASGYEEETLIVTCLSFALHFEESEKVQSTDIGEDGCVTEYDTTVEEEPDEATETPHSNTGLHTQTQIPDISEDVQVESKPVHYEFGPEESAPVPELVFKKLESRGGGSADRCESSLSPFESLAFSDIPQPTVVNEISEEDVETKQEKKRKSSRLAAKCRQQRKEVEMAIRSTIRTFGSSAASAKSRTGNSLIQSWRDMHRSTCTWLVKMHQHAFRKTTFLAFFLNSVHALRKTMCAARPRPPEVHDLVMRFVVDFNKIHEIGQIRGMHEVAGSLGRLVESCLGKYLASPKAMHSMHVPWLQTKEVIELLFSVTLRSDTIYGLLQLLSRIQIYFLAKWADRRDRNEEFIAYAVSQIQNFSSILSQRLVFIANRNKYNEI